VATGASAVQPLSAARATKRRAAFLRPYILLVPAVAVTAVLLIWPIVSILRFSLYTHEPGTIYVERWTLQNYRDLLNPYFAQTLGRTIRFSVITCLICTVLGYPTAYFISRVAPRYKSLLIFLMVLPLLVGSVIRTYGWIILLSRDSFLAQAIDHLPGDHSAGILGTEPAVIAGLVDALLPFMILPLMSSMNRIGPALEDAASVLGARPWQVWRHVVIPMSIPGLVSGTLLVYILCMGALVAPLYLGGEGFQTLSTQVWSDMLSTLDWPAGSAIAVVLMTWIAVTSYLYLQITGRIGYSPVRQR
jgi:putative spermidine/putrescine transport system permease protein